MALTTGQTLHNRYRIVKLLGQGGFGAVYRAWDVNLNGPCAIKENFDTSQAAQQQFAREASLLYNLRHPNLPRVTDHFSIPDQGQYLVMDFIEGEDLQQILDTNGGPLPEAQVLPWITQICDALQYLHRQNPPVIHRDIKPANIRINKEGQAMLVDFGIAKIYDPKMRTTMGARAVTPGFSPPEQYGQGNTDAQSDIYALGATLYALLTGQTAPDSVDILTRHAAPVQPAGQLNPKISPQVSAAIQRAMQLDKADRYTSMADFKQALQGQANLARPAASPAAAAQTSPAETLKAPEPIPAPVASRPAAPPRSAPPPSAPADDSRQKAPARRTGLILVLILLFAGLLVCGGGGFYIYSQWENWFPVTPAEEILFETDTPEAPPTVSEIIPDTPVVEIQPEDPTATPEPAAGSANELTLWYVYAPGSAEEAALQIVLATFAEQYPYVKLIAQHISFDQIFDLYQKEVAGGGGPDMFLTPNDDLGTWARDKLVLDITDYIGESLTDYSSAAVEGMTVDGRLYGVPESAKLVALYYNKSMLPEPPSDTVELSKMVADGKVIVNVLGAYHLFGWMTAFGGEILDYDGRCIADQGGWDTALTYLLELQSLGAIFEPDYSSAENLFLSGSAAMFVNGPWAMEDYRARMGDNLGVAQMPDGLYSASPLMGIDGFYINPNSINIKLAIEAALFLTNQQSATLFTEKGGHIPVRLDVFPSNPLQEAFANAAIFGYPRPQSQEFANYWGPFGDMLTSVLQNGSDPSDAVQKACAAMNAANGK